MINSEREISSEFPFEIQEVDVSDYFTEENLKFDSVDNPDGIFTSDDNDTTTFSDAEARQELIELNESAEESLISYIDVGNPEGDPIVFFHGLPTSKFLWRNVIPELPDDARIIAFDQIGFGDSSKPDITYTYKQHLAHVEAFFAELDLDEEQLTLVNHDSGGTLGFAYAARHEEQIEGLAFFETAFGPIPSFDLMPEQAQFFRSLEGQRAIIEDNIQIRNLIERSSEIVPGSDRPFTQRQLSPEEIAAYNEPFQTPEDREVLAQFVRELPVVGGDENGFGDTNINIFTDYAEYLATSDVEKLFLHLDPGVLTTEPTVEFVEENFNAADSLTSVDLGEGFHFIQEDQPKRIGQEIAEWFEEEVIGSVIGDIAFEGFPYRSNFVELSNGLNMHFLDEGEGDPILLLHGNPTSSFLWRNIIPELSERGRVIVPDLINFGKSDKTEPLDIVEHSELIGEFITELGLEDITYVLQDWGGPIGLIDAAKNPDNVEAIAFFESPVIPFPSFNAVAEEQPEFIDTFIDPANTQSTIIDNNLFIEEFLLNPEFGATNRNFTELEKSIYREPFLDPASREQLRLFPLQIPFLDTTGHPFYDPDGVGGEPPEPVLNIEAIIDSADYLATTDVPKLFIASDPGLGFSLDTIPFFQSSISGLQVATVGSEENPAFHFVQEDVPEELSTVLADWIDNDFTVENSVEPTFESNFGSVDGDIIEVESDNELVFAGSGDNLIDASNSEGSNRIYAGGGNDTLILGRGDVLVGGEGEDRFLSQGQGDNQITGGVDAAQFWITVAELPESASTITDFELDTDVIGVAGIGASSTADLTFSQDGDNTIIGFDGTDLAVIQSIDVNTLENSTSFAFA
ncbi:MAG: haloalkane dehalogenase [Pleurocapsa sp. MO_192.B19]|nr:haloalkane dehalogenase [Pleurocapsa sp. MO_192.B19]